MTHDERLLAWLEGGGSRIGQLLVARRPGEGGFELRHVDDAGRDAGELEEHVRPEDSRGLGLYDAGGDYRPVRYAGNLAGGWRLLVDDITSLRRAIDGFYPACVGIWVASLGDRLPVTGIGDTLGRQTGMYRITQLLSEEGRRRTIDGTCAGCLRVRLWDPSDRAGENLPGGAIPLLCTEGCNFLVAACRKAAKAEHRAREAAKPS